jgi:ATP-dependent helicase HrpB
LGEPVGQSVGYRIRQETKVSANTVLEIVTEGVLTRMIQSDPELSGIDLVIFDEFHERSIHADLALTLSLEIQGALRDDLKLLIMSATLDSEYLAHLIDAEDFVGWDSKGEKLVAETRQKLGKIVLQRKPIKGAIAPEQRSAAFIKLIKTKGLDLLSWSDEDKQLRIPLNTAFSLNAHDWPDYSNAALLETLDEWLAPYLNSITSVAGLKKLDLQKPLLSLLDWNKQQRLDKDFPERFKVPVGNHYRIEYRADQPPKLSVRIQEMFGLTETPTLANCKLPLVIELLSPARRPLQLTQDLAGFWSGSYEQVKKEMKGRYPRSLSENGSTAEENLDLAIFRAFIS